MLQSNVKLLDKQPSNYKITSAQGNRWGEGGGAGNGLGTWSWKLNALKLPYHRPYPPTEASAMNIKLFVCPVLFALGRRNTALDATMDSGQY